MRAILLIFTLIIAMVSSAQRMDFRRVKPSTPTPFLEFVFSGSASALFPADFDMDGDIDIISPASFLYQGREVGSSIYFNDGLGNFSQQNLPFSFENRDQGIMSDIDQDGDMDLLAAYTNEGLKLYLNEGNATFREYKISSVSMRGAKISVLDLENDGDLDIVVHADTMQNGDKHAILFFKQIAPLQFILEDRISSSQSISEKYSAFIVIDKNNDGFDDLLGIGRISRLFINDSSGFFLPQFGPQFPSYDFIRAVQVLDFNEDSLPDIILSGDSIGSSDAFSFAAYSNTVHSRFDFYPIANNPNIEAEILELYDFNYDGKKDIYINGFDLDSNQNRALILRNLGGGVFDNSKSPFDPIQFGSSVFADFNQDGLKDYFHFGFILNEGINKNYFLADSAGFQKVQTEQFDPVAEGRHSIGDIDGDGDQDVIISGQKGGKLKTQIYFNLGNLTFRKDTQTYDGIKVTKQELVDFDQDGDLDLIVGGNEGSSPGDPPIYRLYFNNGNGVFNDTTITLNQGLSPWVSYTCGDIDGDSDVDILINRVVNGSFYTAIHRNDGEGSFSVEATPEFYGNRHGLLHLFDVDNDQDLDLLFTGVVNPTTEVERIYENDGLGSFSLLTEGQIPFRTWGVTLNYDLNQDGFQDLIFPGIGNFYLGNGNGTFNQTANPFGFLAGLNQLKVADFNRDGYPDLIGFYQSQLFSNQIDIYLNDKAGGFYEINNNLDFVLSGGDLSIFDADNDGLDEFLFSGTDFTGNQQTLFYQNINHVSLQESEYKSFIPLFYPSPTKGKLFFSTQEKFSLIRVYDQNGRLVKHWDTPQNEIDVSELSNGLYLINLQTHSGKLINRKFVKQ
ncbi:MAG: T9SS type A sorting domain-containing protein [Vicingaceae bacterium]